MNSPADPAATPPQTARVVNLPNALTLLRLAVVPVFAVLLLTEDLSADEGPGVWAGHAAHQDPEADGTTTVTGVPDGAPAGAMVVAEVVGTEGVDLVAASLVPAVRA